jgi:hypothetical protein
MQSILLVIGKGSHPGTFLTHRLESLYPKSEEPVLYLWGNIFLCDYSPELTTQPYHFSYGGGV